MDDTREFRAKGNPLAQRLSACDDNPTMEKPRYPLLIMS
jgi:hypothetical protein